MNKPSRRAKGIAISVAAAGVVASAIFLPDFAPLPPPGPALGLPFHPSGSFHPLGPAKALDWPGEHAGLDEVDSASTDPLVGTMTSSPFTAPVFLCFYVSGFPSAKDMRLYLRDTQTGATLDLANQLDPGPVWQIRQWRMPHAWRGATVVLVASDGGSGSSQWVGITEPRAGATPIVSSVLRAIHRTFLMLVLGGAFLLPGLAMLLRVAKGRESLSLARAAAILLGGSALTAYALFWLYLWNRDFANAAACTALAASFLAAAVLLRHPGVRTCLPRTLWWSLALVFLVAVFHDSLGFIYQRDLNLGQLAQGRYVVRPLPPDNILQEKFAERVYDLHAGGAPLTQPLIEYWHTSDRPPLQAAITLMEMPFATQDTRELHYQLLGVFLQCTWVAGLWVLLHSLQIRTRYIASVLAFGIISDFCLVHTFYVWSKLLSAAFCFTGMALLPWTRQTDGDAHDGFLVGSQFGFAMLCHPGAAFTIAPALALSCFRSSRWRVAMYAVAAVLPLQIPWMAYQKMADPPGDNLMKIHLAGHIDPQHTLLQSVVNSYSNLTATGYLGNKIQNVMALFGGGAVAKFVSDDWRATLDAFLICTFFYLSFCLGLLCIGVVLRAFGGPRKLSRAWRVADGLLAIATASLAIWCLVMFEPGSTIVHQGSFATVLLIFAACVLYLAEFSPKLVWSLLVMQAFVLFPLFAFGSDLLVARGAVSDGPLDPGMTLMAIGSFGLLARVYWCSQQREALSAAYLPLPAPNRGV